MAGTGSNTTIRHQNQCFIVLNQACQPRIADFPAGHIGQPAGRWREGRARGTAGARRGHGGAASVGASHVPAVSSRQHGRWRRNKHRQQVYSSGPPSDRQAPPGVAKTGAEVVSTQPERAPHLLEAVVRERRPAHRAKLPDDIVEQPAFGAGPQVHQQLARLLDRPGRHPAPRAMAEPVSCGPRHTEQQTHPWPGHDVPPTPASPDVT